jgi:methionyl-tRNA formyltransferase
MRVAFAGTPEFAVASLRAIQAEGHDIVLVLTQPDRPAGRGMTDRFSAIKQAAQALRAPVYQPARLSAPGPLERLREARPDILVVVAYGLILPASVLAAAPRGAINVHASLLPRWRGAAPIQRAILAGDRETGITLMEMDAGLDTGPILLQQSVAIGALDTAGTLHDRLAALGAGMLAGALRPGAKLVARPQPDEGASYAPKIGKGESIINWTLPAEVIARTVRAFDPVPGAQTSFGGAVLKLWRAEAVPAAASELPGTVLEAGAALQVACGTGVLRITEMQRPGGRRLPAPELLRGWTLRPGERLGTG